MSFTPGTSAYIPKSQPNGGQVVCTPLIRPNSSQVKYCADLIESAADAAYTEALAKLMTSFMAAPAAELPELQEKVQQLVDRNLLALAIASRLVESGRAQSAPGSA